MEVFTTEHPLASRTSWSERWPKLSFACSTVFLALIFTPCVYGFLLYLQSTDEVQCTDDPPWPQTQSDFIWGISVIFLIGLLCACSLVLLYRFWLLCRKTRCAA